MTITLEPAPRPGWDVVALDQLAFTTRPERPAEALPVDDAGFRGLVAEAYPDLAYARQRCGSQTIHVWVDTVVGEYTVYFHRADGSHGVKESGFPWHDRLTRLAGMWEATAPSGEFR